MFVLHAIPSGHRARGGRRGEDSQAAAKDELEDRGGDGFRQVFGDALRAGPRKVMLEAGSGSGFWALAELVANLLQRHAFASGVSFGRCPRDRGDRLLVGEDLEGELECFEVVDGRQDCFGAAVAREREPLMLGVGEASQLVQPGLRSLTGRVATVRIVGRSEGATGSSTPRCGWRVDLRRARSTSTVTATIGGATMRFMIIRKADQDTEAGVLPTQEQLTAMTQYNEQLLKAGVLLAGEGLQPSSKGARVVFRGGRSTVIDGPFTEAKELIAGFTMIEARSKEEALEWVRRWPEADVELELRQVFEADDFGEAFTPELRERGQHQRDQLAGS